MTRVFSTLVVRDVITANGADARSFLHSQLSNDIASLVVGGAVYSFVLEPTGKLNALLRVRCIADDQFVVDVDPSCGEQTLLRLNKFKIRVKCEFGLSTQQVVALRGLDTAERAEALLQPGAVSAWRDADSAVDVFTGGNTREFGEMNRYHAERVRCCWPVFGIDIDTDTIPAETSLVDICVSFTKGCYPGQELVERMDSRGSTAPRRMMRLPAREVDVAGTPYVHNGEPIGRCTSVAGDFALVMVTRAHFGEAEALASP